MSQPPGKDAFKGPIRKAVADEVWTKPVATFDPIPCEGFPEIDDDIIREFSTDQAYL